MMTGVQICFIYSLSIIMSEFLNFQVEVCQLLTYTVTLSKPLAMPPFLQPVKYSPNVKRGGGSSEGYHTALFFS